MAAATNFANDEAKHSKHSTHHLRPTQQHFSSKKLKMEDRHSLSEPRPIPGLALPSWEVDVLRDGVDTPIMTILIDNNSLPPRKRKKKVVWKLPDSVDQTPKFGMEDKKRIFEIYRQQKKELRKQRKSSVVGGGTSADMTAAAAAAAADAAGHDKPTVATTDPRPPPGIESSSNRPASSEKRNANLTASKPSPKLQAEVNTKTTSTLSSDTQVVSITSSGKQDKTPLSPAPPGFQKVQVPPKEKASKKQPLRAGSIHAGGSLNGKGDSTRPETARKNPADREMNDEAVLSEPVLANEPQAENNYQHHQQQLLHRQPPGIIANDNPHSQQQASPNGRNGVAATGSSLRQFTVPPTSTLAHVVAESYYLLLANGLVQDLAAHYSPTAQKSCTVGGAHAICQKIEDRAMQLQSLVGLTVQIKGLLQQPTAGNGILVLITGMCIRPHALPFCHSIVLVPVGVGGGYQIQNDALCFLSSDE